MFQNYICNIGAKIKYILYRDKNYTNKIKGRKFYLKKYLEYFIHSYKNCSVLFEVFYVIDIQSNFSYKL